MKLRLMITAMAVGSAVFADSIETGENDVMDDYVYGVMAVTNMASSYTVVGVPWVNVGDNEGVTLSNLLSTATLDENDIVYLYDETTTTTNWYAYKLTAAGTWSQVTTVSGANGVSFSTSLGSAANLHLDRGKGLIVQRASSANPIYLCGRYVSTPPSSTTIPANTKKLIANPLPENKVIDGSVGRDGDQIHIPLDNGKMKIYKKVDGSWGSVVETTKSSRRGGTVTTQTWTPGCTLEAGKGAWYVCGDTAATIAWQND